MSACTECLLDRHANCPEVEVADVQPAEGIDDDGGEYEERTMFCCCGQEWAVVRETVASEYARMNELLKPLQWPDAPQEGGSS